MMDLDRVQRVRHDYALDKTGLSASESAGLIVERFCSMCDSQDGAGG